MSQQAGASACGQTVLLGQPADPHDVAHGVLKVRPMLQIGVGICKGMKLIGGVARLEASVCQHAFVLRRGMAAAHV